VPATVEDWDVPDPAGRPLEDVRAIRDEIEARVKEFAQTRLDEVRGDRTAHEPRLQRVLRPLAEEFEQQKTPEEIRACADAILAQFADAPVRSMVLTLALKQTRECLREPTCAVLSS
jgi:hypothetical protein